MNSEGGREKQQVRNVDDLITATKQQQQVVLVYAGPSNQIRMYQQLQPR